MKGFLRRQRGCDGGIHDEIGLKEENVLEERKKSAADQKELLMESVVFGGLHRTRMRVTVRRGNSRRKSWGSGDPGFAG